MSDLLKVSQNGLVLENVIYQTEQLCLAAVRQNGHALKFVRNQTVEICKDAINKNPFAIMHVKEQTYELCLDAIKRKGFGYVLGNIDSIKLDAPEYLDVCLYAVRDEGMSLKYVNVSKITTNQSYSLICSLAVQQSGYSLQFIVIDKLNNDYFDICLLAIKNASCTIYYVNPCHLSIGEYRTLCKIAINDDPRAYKYINIEFPLPLIEPVLVIDANEFVCVKS